MKHKIILIAINSKYIHPANGIYQLVANCSKDIPFKEFTIKDSVDSILQYIDSEQPDVIGFSVYIWNITLVKKLLKVLKVPIILGGPDASYRANEFFDNYANVSYILKGEGEESFNKLVQHLDGDVVLEEVPNLYYRTKDNKVNFTYFRLPDLTNVRHDFSLMKDFENRISYLESSRGCYFNCSYCLASTEKPVRFFPLDEVKSNLKFLLEHKAKIIKFLDRSFNINDEYVTEILSFIKEHDNNYTTFQFEIVGDRLSQTAIKLINSMRKNSIRLEIGIQTTNPITTNAILRHQDFAKMKQNILAIKDNTVIHTDLIAGLPFEDYESFQNSFNEVFLLFCDELQLGFLKELKGTHISNTKEEHGYLFSFDAPYEVIRNNYITEDELKLVHFVEGAVDKIYNKHLYPLLIEYLFVHEKLDPFTTLLKIGKNLTRSMTLKEIAQMLYSILKDDVSDSEYLLFVIKQDYLSKDNIKPPIWWENQLTKQEQKEIISLFIGANPTLNTEQLYRYGKIEKYKNQYFLIVYKPYKQIYTLNR